MKDYLVSALVPTYNAGKFMHGLLESLEAQTIADKLQIVVVDTASPANEKEIVEKFQEQYDNIVYIRTEVKENSHAATIRCMKAAIGKYFTLACTDDRHRHDVYERMVAVLEARPDIALTYANVYVTKVENETFENFTYAGKYQWLDFDPWKLLYCCFIGPQPMWRKSLHEQYGYSDGDLESAGDWEFWLRMSGNENFLHIDEFLGLYLYSPTSSEHKNPELSRKEAEIVHKRYINRETQYRNNFIKAKMLQGVDCSKFQKNKVMVDLNNRHQTDISTDILILVAHDNEPVEQLESCISGIRKQIKPSATIKIQVVKTQQNIAESNFNINISPKTMTVSEAVIQALSWEADFVFLISASIIIPDNYFNSMLAISALDSDIAVIGPANINGCTEDTTQQSGVTWQEVQTISSPCILLISDVIRTSMYLKNEQKFSFLGLFEHLKKCGLKLAVATNVSV